MRAVSPNPARSTASMESQTVLLEQLRALMVTVARLEGKVDALRADLADPAIVPVPEFVAVLARCIGSHVFGASELLEHAAVDPELRRVVARFQSPAALGNFLKYVSRHPPAGWQLRHVGRESSGVLWALSPV